MAEENFVVEMTDSEGNVYYYTEELIISVGEDKFALLVALHDDDCDRGEECDCCDDDEVIIAKIVVNEDGEEEYIEPTDEEFEMVSAAYDELMSDDV